MRVGWEVEVDVSRSLGVCAGGMEEVWLLQMEETLGRVYSWRLWSLASSFCPLPGVKSGWRVGRRWSEQRKRKITVNPELPPKLLYTRTILGLVRQPVPTRESVTITLFYDVGLMGVAF